MGEILQLLTVFGLGAIELWAAIPTGFALGVNPLLTGFVSALGAIFGGILVTLLGERARAWIIRRRGAKVSGEGKEGVVMRAWRRYGVAGLGLLAPWITGAPLGVALGLALGAPAGRLLFWTSVGIVICSIGLTLTGYWSLAGIEKL